MSKRDRNIAMIAYTEVSTDARVVRAAKAAIEAGFNVDFYTLREDNKFDIVFSNSVIEHVGDFYDQMKMAKEIQRVGKAYYVQTPNYYFPIEPHYRAIGFQFLPFNTKVYALQKFKMGRAEKITDRNSAINEANRIRLLKPKELKYLFPQANIFKERFFGFTKSLIAYYGFILK
ncbi:MAG TPA: class I SAM-dependent methyltransferase [Bacteroidales bacterium]|nr:class I SAM-dependent methyltransferase [Bacteroidales bacterium]